LSIFAEVSGPDNGGAIAEVCSARTYIDALRNLARSDLPDRVKLIEKNIDLYLEEGARGRALEDLRSAIHNEESERREGEDWSIAGEYVHALLQQTKS
jgi:hypothetical protein